MVSYDWNKIKRAAVIRKSVVTVGVGSVMAILLVSVLGQSVGFVWLSLIFVFMIGTSFLFAWQLVSVPAMITHKDELLRLKSDLNWLSQIGKEEEFSQWASETGCLAETILKDGSAYQAEYILCTSMARYQKETARLSDAASDDAAH